MYIVWMYIIHNWILIHFCIYLSEKSSSTLIFHKRLRWIMRLQWSLKLIGFSHLNKDYKKKHINFQPKSLNKMFYSIKSYYWYYLQHKNVSGFYIFNFHKFFPYIQSIHILILFHYCKMFFVYSNLQSVNSTLLSMSECNSQICVSNF